ncbi:DUF2490 domain-containing protein [Flagellimonas allohymeniacidonis]|uniref:DUF2490 domain-containing protein n=1 Tax=Flagellimonas allohymeniacidonis TaxID=2517819 RepID=A0A4Q8QFL3_9FLAO|nr:DUF2490 domain-containing protein [Allomuricauda hymeniacidonis]TAI47109.1 DUF2490 domain-containing protein [Allomuricauda hymeniacidonis]
MGGAEQLTYSSLFTLFFTLTFVCLHGQDFKDDHSDSWYIVVNDSQLNERWSIPTIGIIRYHDVFENREFSFISSGLRYSTQKNSSFTLGVAYLNAETHEQPLIDTASSQIWLFESFTIKHPLVRGLIDQRFRLESRWIQNSTEDFFTNRIRYRIQYIRPIYKKTFLRMFNELFVNLDESFFNQNRFYVGFGQKLSKTFTFDMGYLKNHFPNENRDVLRMCLTITSDFKKKDLAYVESPDIK